MLFAAIKRFFDTVEMLLSWKSTHAALIRKIIGTTKQEQYRPISLCCTLYKILAKVLVNRLKGVIDKLISLEQVTFVRRRSISDNILLVQELAHSLGNARVHEGLVMAKLDMERACDRMDWDFLFNVLAGIGFNETWIS